MAVAHQQVNRIHLHHDKVSCAEHQVGKISIQYTASGRPGTVQYRMYGTVVKSRREDPVMGTDPKHNSFELWPPTRAVPRIDNEPKHTRKDGSPAGTSRTFPTDNLPTLTLDLHRTQVEPQESQPPNISTL